MDEGTVEVTQATGPLVLPKTLNLNGFGQMGASTPKTLNPEECQYTQDPWAPVKQATGPLVLPKPKTLQIFFFFFTLKPRVE